MEEWTNINGYENYKISNTGRVINIVRNKELKPCIGGAGYAVITLSKHNKTKTYNIHRLVAEHFLDEPTEEQIKWAFGTKRGKVHVNHKDGNKTNNHVDNLEWCTTQENTKHAYNMGLSTPVPPENKGSTNGQSKLTEDKVLEIRKLFKDGTRQHELAKMYNIDSSLISRIVNRKRWKHI